MSKTVKGARIRLKRSDKPNVIPTIPSNDDHTTGWLDTDIYIGELFLNTNGLTPAMWFRDASGITQISTLNKLTNKIPYDQLTHNVEEIYYTGTTTITGTTIITEGTQYVVVETVGISSSSPINPVYKIDLTNLESIGYVIYLSVGVKVVPTYPTTMTVSIINSLGVSVVPLITTSSTYVLHGICLMWNGVKWVVISNTTN